jgi:hypothetical protein
LPASPGSLAGHSRNGGHGPTIQSLFAQVSVHYGNSLACATVRTIKASVMAASLNMATRKKPQLG